MIICSLYARVFVSRRLISFRARASVQYDAVWISSAHFIMFLIMQCTNTHAKLSYFSLFTSYLCQKFKFRELQKAF